MYITDYTTKKSKKIVYKDKLGVEDLRWNPRENYLLVAFREGSLAMLNMDGVEI